MERLDPPKTKTQIKKKFLPQKPLGTITMHGWIDWSHNLHIYSL